MPLYEFYTGKKLTEKSREKNPYVQGLKIQSPKVTFNKICSIVDEVIEQLVTEKLGKLVYTRTGFLLGNQSQVPHVDCKYIWEKVPFLLIGKLPGGEPWDEGESKLVLQTIGSLVMWRISLRGEEWYVSFLESGRFDFISGNEIKIAQYWTNGVKPYSRNKLQEHFARVET